MARSEAPKPGDAVGAGSPVGTGERVCLIPAAHPWPHTGRERRPSLLPGRSGHLQGTARPSLCHVLALWNRSASVLEKRRVMRKTLPAAGFYVWRGKCWASRVLPERPAQKPLCTPTPTPVPDNGTERNYLFSERLSRRPSPGWLVSMRLGRWGAGVGAGRPPSLGPVGHLETTGGSTAGAERLHQTAPAMRCPVAPSSR